MKHIIDEALARATWQATHGPREMRRGRFMPTAAETIHAKVK